jgi:signal transduction histidine kinase
MDDGQGLDERRPANGFGLRGIEERVRELGGAVSIYGGRSAGTTLTIQLPLVEAMNARAAG